MVLGRQHISLGTCDQCTGDVDFHFYIVYGWPLGSMDAELTEFALDRVTALQPHVISPMAYVNLASVTTGDTPNLLTSFDAAMRPPDPTSDNAEHGCLMMYDCVACMHCC